MPTHRSSKLLHHKKMNPVCEKYKCLKAELIEVDSESQISKVTSGSSQIRPNTIVTPYDIPMSSIGS